MSMKAYRAVLGNAAVCQKQLEGVADRLEKGVEFAAHAGHASNLENMRYAVSCVREAIEALELVQ